MKTVLLYSSFLNMDKAITSPQFRVLETFQRKDRMTRFCQDTLEVIDILFFVENKNENSIEYLLDFHAQFPKVRIIYVVPEIDLKNTTVVEEICSLIDKEIYDIYYGEEITKRTIQNLLKNPYTKNDNENFLFLRKKNREFFIKNYAKDKKEKEIEEAIIEEKSTIELVDEVVEGNVTPGYDNIIIVSSIKPGTGKSFITVNLATAIAKYGRPKADGEKPKVAIIEGDLQTLAVGTLLKVENDRYNLKTALEAVKKVVDANGHNFGTEEENEAVRKFILKCFHPYGDIGNFYVLSASQIGFEDWENVNPYHYFYLIETVVADFDIIFVDSNSALEHKTTGPVLQLANVCLYVIDLEYNNIRMNLRYQQMLRDLGVFKKIRYILNKDISKCDTNNFAETLEYDANSLAKDFHVLGRIPFIDTSVMLNRLHSGRPVVLDTTEMTIDARMEFANIADKIWDMDNILSLKIEKEIFESKKKKEPNLVDKLFKDDI